MSEIVASYPELSAVAVLILGLVIALIARSGVARAARSAQQLFGDYAHAITPRAERTTSALVFWAILIVAMFLALRLLGIAQLSRWLDGALALVPQLLVGLAIVGAGHLIGIALGDVTRRLGPQVGALLGPRMVYGAVMAIAIITGVEQIGVDLSFVIQIALVAFAVLMSALGLAFALGARQHVANLAARSETGNYVAGERLRIDGDEGTVVEIRSTALVLATDEGLVAIPAARFAETRVVKLPQQST